MFFRHFTAFHNAYYIRGALEELTGMTADGSLSLAGANAAFQRSRGIADEPGEDLETRNRVIYETTRRGLELLKERNPGL